MRQILVCVTFREFDGSTNAKIQQRFLDGIRRQDYKNFKLIVTNFREKLVRQTLDESNLPYEFHQSEKDCRISWTEVIQTSFQYLEKGRHIILWTNADNVFEPNLFSEIVKNFEPRSGGTSYPPIHYASLQDFERKRPTDTWKNRPLRSFYQMDPNYWVPEAIYLDGDIFLNPENERLFLKHYFVEWATGQAVTLCLAFFAEKLKNLIYKSKIHAIKNVKTEDPTIKRLAQKEKVSAAEAAEIQKRLWESDEARQAMANLIDFCRERGIAEKYIPGCHPLKKLNQNREYKPVGRLDQKLAYGAYMRYWVIRHSLRPTYLAYRHRLKSLVLSLYKTCVHRMFPS